MCPDVPHFGTIFTNHAHHPIKNAMKDLTNEGHEEGKVAKTIENQTAKLPSDLFLWAALGTMGVSLAFKIMKQKHTALFVGQWAAPFLLLGVYNKIVKTQGHDDSDSDDEY